MTVLFTKRLLSPSRIGFIFLTLIASCGAHTYHVVEPGETLYSIGWLYGYDYRQLAKWNNIRSPYRVKYRQRIRVAPRSGVNVAANRVSNAGSKAVPASSGRAKEIAKKVDKTGLKPPKSATKIAPTPSRSAKLNWFWPVKRGKVVQGYEENSPGKKGLEVAGKLGQSIYAAAPGQVVYSGSGLPRYGKLIIIKHDDSYLSAYAHNQSILVKEGDKLHARQKIALMGSTGTNRVKLHFEIRRNGKSVNPMRYLPQRMPN